MLLVCHSYRCCVACSGGTFSALANDRGNEIVWEWTAACKQSEKTHCEVLSGTSMMMRASESSKFRPDARKPDEP